MSRLARQVLRVFMVVVAVGAGSLNGYLSSRAALEHARMHGHEALHAAHDHAAAAHGAHQAAAPVGGHELAACAPQSCDTPDDTAHTCADMHVHCCSTYAVPAADCGLAPVRYAGAVLRIADSHIPPGEIAAPLFRPPRAAA